MLYAKWHLLFAKKLIYRLLICEIINKCDILSTIRVKSFFSLDSSNSFVTLDVTSFFFFLSFSSLLTHNTNNLPILNGTSNEASTNRRRAKRVGHGEVRQPSPS